MNKSHLEHWLVFLSCLSVALSQRMLSWNNCRQGLECPDRFSAGSFTTFSSEICRSLIVPFPSLQKKFITSLKMFIVEGQAQISAKRKRIAQLNLSHLRIYTSVNATKSLFKHFLNDVIGLKCLWMNEWMKVLFLYAHRKWVVYVKNG